MTAKLAAIIGGLALATIGQPAAAHTIANWTETASKIAEEGKPPGPPDARLRAQVALAMFEAVNMCQHQHASFMKLPESAGCAEAAELAAARAAYEVLAALHPARTKDLAEALTLARLAIADGSQRDRAEAAGRAAASAVLARPPVGSGQEPPYIPAAIPGRYIGTDLPAVAPKATLARPYFIESPRGVAPPPPPGLNTERYARDVEEVRRLGGKASERTPEQTAIGAFWSRQDVLAPLRRLTSAPQRSLAQNAFTYARITMALDDASNAVSTAKLDHGLWRPVTAIRNGDADGNPGTRADPSWEPLLRTPPHPEYPCGHCIVVTTFARLVEAEFGPSARLEFSDAAVPATSRTLTPGQLIEETSLSRILAGAHFRFSAEAGQAMGEAIATRAAEAMKARDAR